MYLPTPEQTKSANLTDRKPKFTTSPQFRGRLKSGRRTSYMTFRSTMRVIPQYGNWTCETCRNRYAASFRHRKTRINRNTRPNRTGTWCLLRACYRNRKRPSSVYTRRRLRPKTDGSYTEFPSANFRNLTLLL